MPKSDRTTSATHRHGHASNRKKPGSKLSPEYTAWRHLKERCLNPSHPCWPNYGGRGITVCDEWRDDFRAFLADMGSRPSSGHTIERVDNDKGYSKGNCVWATRKEQSNNTRKTVHHELGGEVRNQSDWGRFNGIPQSTISLRLKRGWSQSEALTAPPIDHRGKRYEHDGKSLTIAEWSRETGVASRLIGQRLGNGWSVADAVTMKSAQKTRGD